MRCCQRLVHSTKDRPNEHQVCGNGKGKGCRSVPVCRMHDGSDNFVLRYEQSVARLSFKGRFTFTVLCQFLVNYIIFYSCDCCVTLLTTARWLFFLVPVFEVKET